MTLITLLPAFDSSTLLLTALAAFFLLTQLGRTQLANAYLHLVGTHPSTLASPVSYFGACDTWPAFDSFSLPQRIWKLLLGVPDSVRSGRAGLREHSLASGSTWRQICNFAVETSSDVWTPANVLEQWRRSADPSADAAATTLLSIRRLTSTADLPDDALSAIVGLCDPASARASNFTAALPEHHPAVDSSHPFRTFMDEVQARPPRGCGAISEAWYAARDTRRQAAGIPPDFALSTEELAEELSEEARVIRAGQNVFFKYVESMQLTLLHFSLAGGFSAPRILSVLQQTGYLVPSREPGAKLSNSSKHASEAQASGTSAESFLLPHAQLSPGQQRSADRTFTRLLETTQFVTDIMQDVDALLAPPAWADPWTRAHYSSMDNEEEALAHSLRGIGADEARFLGRVGGGRGWQSAVRVRLLHANVRAQISQSVSSRRTSDPAHLADAKGRCPFDTRASLRTGDDDNAPAFDFQRDGQPINQEDLLATLAGFSVAPLWCLSRLRLPLTAQEREDYVALWRHVGFYLGCDPLLLTTHFRDARSALGLFFSIVAHVYPESITNAVTVQGSDGTSGALEAEKPFLEAGQEDATEAGGTVAALALLQAVASRPPLGLSMALHCGLSRHLLGPCLANYLHLPPTTPQTQFRIDLLLLTTRVPPHFTAHCPLYPARLRTAWEARRIRLAKTDLRRAVGVLLGGTLATFGGRRAGAGGKVGVAVVSATRRSVVEWERRRVMAEMSAWIIGCALVIGVCALYAYRALSSLFAM